MSVVRVLGPVDVVAGDGSVHASGSALRRTLLALLAIHRGEVLSPDWLMEHVWGDEQPDSGVRALRFHVSQLRKECGEIAPIETRPGGYQLDLPTGSVDADIFEQLASQARVEPDDLRSVELCDQALALWRGEPFVDAAACATLDHEAGRLEELRLAVVEYSFVRRLAGGAAGEVVSDLSQLVNQHPLREGLWSSLITAHYRAGHQAEALASYERVRANLAESLGLDPSPELRDLQGRVLRQDPDLTVEIASADDTAGRSPRHNLPASVTSFVELPGGFGRLHAVLDEHRLVTLTGSGGVGKTRLAIELGMRSLDRFRDGVRLIELAQVGESDAVPGAMAKALSVHPQPGSTVLESIIDWCHGREVLLIVDNCEHVIDAISESVAELLARCPTISIIATSRESLGIDGERVHRVASLDRTAGIELFVQRATAADSKFDADDTQAIGSLSDRLDGIPLAIELAAARVRSMSPAELLERLDDRFRLLRGTARGRHNRHQTLRATVAWSYQLLSDDERVVFERASVFAGGFDLPAAEAICSSDAIDSEDVIDLLAGLVDKSMVTASHNATTTRYHLLETLRQFAEEQLVARQDGDSPHDRHLTYYVELAQHTDRIFRGPREVEGRAVFEIEWDNLRAAHDWAVATDDLDRAEDIVEAIWLYAESRVRLEFGDWVERTLALESEDRRARPHTYGLASKWAYWAERDDLGAANARAQQGIAIAPSPDHPGTAMCWALAGDDYLERVEAETGVPGSQMETVISGLDLDRDWWALVMLVFTAWSAPHQSGQGDRLIQARARRTAWLADTARRVGAPTLQAWAALAQGFDLIGFQDPDPEHALECCLRALTTAREAQNLNLERHCLRAVVVATTGVEADERAADTCRTALVQLRESADWELIWKTMESAALVLATLGQLEQASIALGHTGAPDPNTIENEMGFRQRSLELVRQADRFEEWMTRGAEMDRDEIVNQTIKHLAAAAAG